MPTQFPHSIGNPATRALSTIGCEYIEYIDEAKAKATRERRIAKTVEMLRGRA